MRRMMFDDLARKSKDRGEQEALRSMADPIWSGMVAYRGLVPASALDGEELAHALTPRMVS